MRLLSILGRLALLAGLLVPALPALAGPAETALLAKYEGTWKGKGTVSGPNPGTVVCRLTFKTATSGKLNYSGRCSFGAGGTSFSGAMIYNDTKGRFESVSSSTGFSATTIGKKQGGGIVFVMTPTDTTYGTASSTMTLGTSSIKLSFKLVDKKGQTTASSISFAKS